MCPSQFTNVAQWIRNRGFKPMLLGSLFTLPLILAAPAAKATPFTDLSSAGAGPDSYAVLGLGVNAAEVDLSLVTVTGNVGIGGTGSISNMAPSAIIGNVFEATSGQYSGPGLLTGTVTTNASLLSTNIAGANQAATDAAALPATQTFASITTATTITGVAGLNVIDITGGINLNNANLTLSGPANALFVIDVGADLSLTGTAALNLSGGVTASDTLYNFESPTASINTHVGDVVNGILLAAGSGSSMNLDGSFYGELIGNQISLLSGATVTASGSSSPPPPTTQVPEPASLSLMLAGFLGLGLFGRRARKS